MDTVEHEIEVTDDDGETAIEYEDRVQAVYIRTARRRMDTSLNRVRGRLTPTRTRETTPV
jgi:hypothetical protein